MTRVTIAAFVLLTLTGMTQDSQVKTLRDITGIEREQESASDGVTLWLLGVGLVVLLVAVGGAWLLRMRKKHRSRLPADVWAKHELTRIAALDLGAKGKADRHHYLVSNVLRGYIEKRYGLAARQQTTPEFLKHVLEDPRISAEQWKTLERLLSQCDLGKFTGSIMSASECRALTDRVLEYVEKYSVSITEY